MQVSQLAGLLAEPPQITRGWHLALFQAFSDLRLPSPDVGQLRDVDNFHVQRALAWRQKPEK